MVKIRVDALLSDVRYKHKTTQTSVHTSCNLHAYIICMVPITRLIEKYVCSAAI